MAGLKHHTVIFNISHIHCWDEMYDLTSPDTNSFSTGIKTSLLINDKTAPKKKCFNIIIRWKGNTYHTYSYYEVNPDP